ncbi:MAG: hypothetical protein KatS3mg112_1811 [Thermogutta sp.]|nr:MAG: hypothetical protein KatS3mg112_1811 [Thermogutta sp.]
MVQHSAIVLLGRIEIRPVGFQFLLGRLGDSVHRVGGAETEDGLQRVEVGLSRSRRIIGFCGLLQGGLSFAVLFVILTEKEVGENGQQERQNDERDQGNLQPLVLTCHDKLTPRRPGF